MKFLLMVRIGFGLLVFGLLLAFWIYPSGMWIRFWTRRASEAQRRVACASHITRSGALLNAAIGPIIGLRLQVRLPPGWNGPAGRAPLLYVSNHLSTLDALVLLEVATRMGDFPMRWVIKLEVLRYLFVGALMRGTGNAAVMRRKDRPNTNREIRRQFNRVAMRRFLDAARADAVSVGVFPEGERFTGPKPGARRTHVGDPFPEGFRQMCAALPGHDVAVVRVRWPKGRLGRTVFDLTDLCDITVPVDIDLFPHVAPEDAAAFLEAQWDETDRRIETNGR